MHLPGAGLVTELQGRLVDLGETGGAARVAAGGETAIGREWDPPAETGGTLSHESVSFAVAADAQQFVVDEFLDGKRAVHLDEIEIVRSHSRLLVGIAGCVASHLCRADDGAEEDVAIGVGLGALLRGGDADQRAPRAEAFGDFSCRDDRRCCPPPAAHAIIEVCG